MKNVLLHKNLLLIIVIDALLLSVAWIGACLLRFNFQIPQASTGLLFRSFPLVIGLKVFILYVFDLYRGMWRYMGIGDLLKIIKAASVSSFIIVSLILFSHGFTDFAPSIPIIDWFLTIGFISGSRLIIRFYFSLNSEMASGSAAKFPAFWRKKNSGLKKLLIIGAGNGGEMIFREIRDNAKLGYHVVGFIDDDVKKVGKKIHGISILGTTKDLGVICTKLNTFESIIAIPSATSDQMRSIISYCKRAQVSFKTVPGLGELINGKVSVKSIRDVAYQDLLGREAVQLEQARIGNYLENARVLVTGAGGSIGSELCRQICRFSPSCLILYDWAESALYEIELELKENFKRIEITPLLADVCDNNQLNKTFATFQPHVVFHAAAYKHVPMLEIQPWKAITNNIFGTRNLINISNAYTVKRFVFVSTDKAVRPTSIMGATKRIAERLIQSQNGKETHGTRFMIVRFGNVVGSSGSVVPLFKKQIEKGGPITVTHPEVTRFFMTITEACRLILQAGAMGEGGETFILDMGIPIKIVDMAHDLIRLSGLEPDKDIKLKYIGLRPGEKLFEELVVDGEGTISTSHEKIMALRGRTYDQTQLNGEIDELICLAKKQNPEEIKLKLQQIVPEYSPAEYNKIAPRR